MFCQNCKREVPTWNVTFYQVIGLLVGFSHKRITGHLCENCISKFFDEYTLTTLALGWWSAISFLLTPAVIISNIWNKMQTRKPPESAQRYVNQALSNEVLSKLRPFHEEILDRIHFKERLDMIVPSISSRAGVTTAEVDRYIQTVITPEVLFGTRKYPNR
jgi:hypothetical protein